MTHCTQTPAMGGIPKRMMPTRCGNVSACSLQCQGAATVPLSPSPVLMQVISGDTFVTFLKWFASSCKWGTSQPTKCILSQCETRAWHNGVFLQFDYVLLHVWVETWKKIYQTQWMQLSSFIIWMVAELYHRNCIVATIRDAYCS